MTATAEFRRMLDELDQKLAESGAAEARLKAFEGAMQQIAGHMADLVLAIERKDEKGEKPEMEHKPPDFGPIVSAIQGIAAGIKIDIPATVVNVPPMPPMPVQKDWTTMKVSRQTRDGPIVWTLTKE